MRENLCFKLHSRPSKFVLGGPPLAGKQRDLFDNLSQGCCLVPFGGVHLAMGITYYCIMIL